MCACKILYDSEGLSAPIYVREQNCFKTYACKISFRPRPIRQCLHVNKYMHACSYMFIQ